MLEVLVHLEIDPEDFPDTMQLLRIELPDSVSFASAPELPPGWSAETAMTREIGNRFLDEASSLLLAVPSAIIPSTVNYLFNPRHPEASLASVQVELFTPDSRLF